MTTCEVCGWRPTEIEGGANALLAVQASAAAKKADEADEARQIEEMRRLRAEALEAERLRAREAAAASLRDRALRRDGTASTDDRLTSETFAAVSRELEDTMRRLLRTGDASVLTALQNIAPGLNALSEASRESADSMIRFGEAAGAAPRNRRHILLDGSQIERIFVDEVDGSEYERAKPKEPPEPVALAPRARKFNLEDE